MSGQVENEPAEPTADRRKRLLELVPTWVQAVTGVLALAVTLFGVSFVASRGESTEAEVRLIGSSVGAMVTANGEYLDLRTDQQRILVIVQLDGNETYVPLDVELEPLNVDDGRESGTWSGSAEVSAEQASFEAVVTRAGPQGVDAAELEELRTQGANASVVEARSGQVVTTAAP